jgi:hypothetical protein
MKLMRELSPAISSKKNVRCFLLGPVCPHNTGQIDTVVFDPNVYGFLEIFTLFKPTIVDA